MIKKTLIFIVGILLVLTLFVIVNAFEYNEDNRGNSFYELDAEVKVPSINIKDLFILQPSSEPSEPVLGMIYFDSISKRLKLYDGTGWYSIALEKVSHISKEEVKKEIAEKDLAKTCEFSITCDEWGDCINNYRSMTCITTDENCNRHTNTETEDCIFENPFKEEIEQAKRESLENETTVPEEVEEEPGMEEPEVEEEPGMEESEVEEEPEEKEEQEVPEPGPEPEEAIPEALFDITFDLEESVLSKSDKLVVWITLQNFGRKYVPTRLIYSVINNKGKEVYRSFEELRVYTDESIIKQFDDLVLEEGDYTLIMNVEYAGIVEEFSVNFSVEGGIFSIIKRFFERLF